jgi:hypothetical protein
MTRKGEVSYVLYFYLQSFSQYYVYYNNLYLLNYYN